MDFGTPSLSKITSPVVSLFDSLFMGPTRKEDKKLVSQER